MTRIALIRNSYSYDVGGAEIFPISVAKVIASLGIKPYMLSSNKKTLDIAKGVKVSTVRSPWLSFQNFSGLKIFLLPLYLLWIIFVTVWYVAFFVKNRIDVAHPQSRDDFVAATLAAKLLNKRVVWTDHADLKYIYMNHKKWYKNPVGKLVYFISKLADHVMIESYSEKSLIERALGRVLPGNYTVIYIGVVDTYKPVKRDHDKLVLTSTSRLVKAKGVGELIKAFKSIDNANLVLKLCGDGPDAKSFQTLAKDLDNVEFLGHVDNVGQVLQNSDILVHPSHHEGFGLSLVEAEMYGLPIIACKVGAVPEIVKDGVSGILVPPNNTEDLARAINSLVGNPKLRKEMGHAGRQIFLDNFQLDKIVRDQIIPLYNK